MIYHIFLIFYVINLIIAAISCLFFYAVFHHVFINKINLVCSKAVNKIKYLNKKLTGISNVLFKRI